MKSLSLSKPLIITVVGLPGSGKSFFARQFSDTFMAPRISYDFLIKTLGSTYPLSKEAKARVEKLLENQTQELLKTQKTFIIDGGLQSRSDRIKLQKLAKEHGYDVLLVWVQVDEQTAKYRSANRSARRSDDVDNQSLTLEQYTFSARQFSPPHPTENQIVISGKHTYATQAKVVLKKLVTPREEVVPNQSIRNHEGRAPARQDPGEVSPRRSVIVR